MNTGKLILNIVLALGVLGLTFMLYKSIEEPISVENARSKRTPATFDRLLEIKKAEMAFLEAKGHFAGDFDSLIYVIKHDSVPEIKIIGNPDLLEEDSTAVVTYDTSYVRLIVKAFNDPHYNLDSLKYIPYTGGKKIDLKAGTIEELGRKVPVFEASVAETVMLHDQVQKYVDREKLWKVGSMTEAKYDGNWE